MVLSKTQRNGLNRCLSLEHSQSKSEYSLFSMTFNNVNALILVYVDYVDDVLISGNNSSAITILSND